MRLAGREGDSVLTVADYEGQSQADADFWQRFEEVPSDLRVRIESLRPPRPASISATDGEMMARWAAAWRVAALSAIAVGGDSPDRELRIYVWYTSRSLFESDIPTD